MLQCDRRHIFLLITLAWAFTSQAKVQTFNYISLDNQPLYAEAKNLPFANVNATKGGAIIFPGTGTFDNLNSMNGKGSAGEGVQFLYDTLMANSLDESGVMYPLLAESVTYDPTKPKYVIFHLNQKAKFSDSTPVTAQDIKYTFDKILTEGAPGLRIYLSEIENITALSKYDVRFDFKTDTNKEMPLIVSAIPIFSKKNLQNYDFTRVTLQAPLGSGPYIVDKVDAGRSISYRRNPDYWAKDVMVNRGAYNFNQIKYVYYRTFDIAFEGFKTGQYTVHTEYTARRWATEYNFNAVNANLIQKLEFHHKNPIPTQSFVFNSRRKPLDDIFFRQALTYAYDFEWQNKALFYGKYKRLQSYFDNSELAATGKPSADELKVISPYLNQLSPIVKRGILLDWKYPVSDGSGFNRYNLMVARQMLLNKGYHYNKKGQLLDQQNQPIKLEFLIHQDGIERTLMPFVRNVKRLGIELTVRKVDVPQYIERKRNYDFDLTTDAMPQSLNPGNEQARFWGSEAADQAGNYNYAGIKDPVIDAMIEQIIRSPNRKQLIINTKMLDRLLRAGYYQIPTYNKDADWYAFWDMYERPKIQPKLAVGMEYWWFNPEKSQKVSQFFRRK